MSQNENLKSVKKFKTLLYAAVGTAGHHHGLEARTACGRWQSVFKDG